jgi:hypothetical protein
MWWRQPRRLIVPLSMTEQFDLAQRRFAYVAILSTVLLFVLIGVCFAKEGDIHTASPLHDWFMSLKSGKGPCCADADGNVVKDSDWESKDGRYKVFLGGEWVNVPPDAVITQPNLDGRTMVWPIWIDGKETVRCFMPGAGA